MSQDEVSTTLTPEGVENTVMVAARLFLPPDCVAELRVLNTPQGVQSGYFDDPEALVTAAMKLDEQGYEGIYVTLNSVKPELLAQAPNTVRQHARQTTGDADILCRRWILLDLDPVRPAELSATAEEEEKAWSRAFEVWCWLQDIGFDLCSLVVAQSGNGYHVLVRVELPNDKASGDLVRRCIEAVALRFSDEEVKVDLGVGNAGRITKLYGTVAKEGQGNRAAATSPIILRDAAWRRDRPHPCGNARALGRHAADRASERL